MRFLIQLRRFFFYVVLITASMTYLSYHNNPNDKAAAWIWADITFIGVLYLFGAALLVKLFAGSNQKSE